MQLVSGMQTLGRAHTSLGEAGVLPSAPPFYISDTASIAFSLPLDHCTNAYTLHAQDPVDAIISAAQSTAGSIAPASSLLYHQAIRSKSVPTLLFGLHLHHTAQTPNSTLSMALEVYMQELMASLSDLLQMGRSMQWVPADSRRPLPWHLDYVRFLSLHSHDTPANKHS